MMNVHLHKLLTFRTLLAGIVLFAGVIGEARILPENMGGNLRLTLTSSEAENRTDQSINQEYTLYWTKQITPYIQSRAAVRYFDLGIDQNQAPNTWRREFQPSGELIWSHPDFVLGGIIRRRISTSNNETTDLIRNSFGVNLSTRNIAYPVLTSRFDWNHIYNDKNRQERDSYERRFQAGLDYTYRVHNLYYSSVYRTSESLSSPADISDWQHLFRWNQTSRFLNGKMRLSSGYNFSYRSQTITRTGSGGIYMTVPYTRALYAIDPTPDLGALDSLNGLSDGNLTDPALPVIDIGEGLLNRNIGVDFGVRRQVNGVYIYTDRPSGTALRWTVYTSDDNLVWEPLPQLVISLFDLNYNRYEIQFDAVNSRYIKLVNSGVNDVPEVYITEVQPLIRVLESDETTLSQMVHLAELGGAYRFSPKLQVNADFSLRNEPRGDFTDSRNQMFCSFGARHRLSPVVSQSARYQGSLDDFKTTSTQNKDLSLSYNLVIKPLSTLEFSFAAMTRTNYINNLKSLETNNLFFQTYGQLLRGLNVTGETTYSRSNRFDARTRFDTWSGRLSADTRLTPSLDAVAYYLYQWTKDLSTDALRIRRQYNLDFNYRLTRKISIRSSLIINQEDRLEYFSQEYSINWILSGKLTAGALVTINDNDNLSRSERNNFRLNYALSSRSTIFLSYTSSEFSLAGRPETKSLQAGLKVGL
jgi:hypothetical protein